MITLAPSNNFKNFENIEKGEQYKMAEHTARETLAIVEKALEKTNSLKKAVIMELPPRANNPRLQSLTEYSNNFLENATRESKYKDQITIGTVVSPSPIDQIWTDFEEKKFRRKVLFLVRGTAKTKIVLKHKLANNDYRRCP